MVSTRAFVLALWIIASFALAGTPLASGQKTARLFGNALVLWDVTGNALYAGEKQPMPLQEGGGQTPPADDADQESDTEDEEDDDEWEA